MALFEEYKNHPDKFVRERANKWAIAIGLQRVDSLKYPTFLFKLLVKRLKEKSQWMKPEH